MSASETKARTGVVRDVIYLAVLIAYMGYAWARFEALERTVEDLNAQETGRATVVEVSTLSDRLRRWIERYESDEAIERGARQELQEHIHDLELYVAAVHGEAPR